MKVPLEPQYTVAGTKRNLRKSGITTILAGLCIVASVEIAAFGPEKIRTIGPVAGLILLSLTLVVLVFLYAGDVAMEGAHRMAGMHQLAERQKIRGDLLTEFRPTQEEVDRRLGTLAHRFSLACKNVAQFHHDHPCHIGDVAEGTVRTADQKLRDELGSLEQIVIVEKATFWDLYSAIEIEGYNMRISWRDYLTYSNVGPDPEVLAGRKA